MIVQKFFVTERAKAKAQATNSLSYDYIEALEQIAKAAYEVWTLSGTDVGKKVKDEKRDALYDALSVVNFLDESMD